MEGEVGAIETRGIAISLPIHGETLRASLAPLAASPSQAHPLRLPPG